MKKLFCLLSVFAFGVLLPAGRAAAQDSRVAYVNNRVIYEQLPENTQITQALKQYREQLQNRYVAHSALFRQKMEEFSSGKAAATAAKEIEDLYEGLKTLEIQNDQAYLVREMELRGPLGARIKQAILAVAQEKDYSGVVDVSEMTYFDASDEITNLVLQKLGVVK